MFDGNANMHGRSQMLGELRQTPSFLHFQVRINSCRHTEPQNPENGDLPDSAPKWQSQEYEVWYRDPLIVMESQIANPDFVGHIDYAPKHVRGLKNNKRQYCDLMSGNWAWDQADLIAEDPTTHGAMFAPVICGSDKTTVSVATGQNEYYPLYASLGNVQNHVRRAHRGAVSVVGFLAIPKTDKAHQDSNEFRKFRRQLFHASLSRILQSLKPWMTTPRVTKCGDRHWRKVIYGLGPYIADYPEQVLLTCVVQGWCPKCTALGSDLDGTFAESIPRSHEHTELLFSMYDGKAKELWDGYGIIADILPFTSEFPRANIHELIAPDLLHQLIKGTFKDHLVTWVVEYIESVNTKSDAKAILSELDRRIELVPSFPGLRRFHEGRGFKQWTGDDSKALMKVFLPAITGLVPDQMVRALQAFLEFCYLIRRAQIDEDVLVQIDSALERFHREREVFIETGIREDFLLPRQHSMMHYRALIQMFGAPNGLCTSITESKHIKAVKEPWRRSNRNNPLGQMLLTNQRQDKLAAAQVHFESRGWLRPTGGTTLGDATNQRRDTDDASSDHGEGDDEDQMEGIRDTGDVKLAVCPARGYPSALQPLAHHMSLPDLPDQIRRFLFDQANPDSEVFGMDVELDECPEIDPMLHIKVFHSAISTYHAPSDLSGIGGMHSERIRATPSWQKQGPRYDCIFVNKDTEVDGFKGLLAAQVALLFSFSHLDKTYPCAYVRWFSSDDNVCPSTGMWTVRPELSPETGQRVTSVIHLGSVLRSAHLIPVYGTRQIPRNLTLSDSMYAFKSYYVNKYSDYHAHEVAF